VYVVRVSCGGFAIAWSTQYTAYIATTMTTKMMKVRSMRAVKGWSTIFASLGPYEKGVNAIIRRCHIGRGGGNVSISTSTSASDFSDTVTLSYPVSHSSCSAAHF